MDYTITTEQLQDAVAAAEERVQSEIDRLRSEIIGKAVTALVAPAVPADLPELHWSCTDIAKASVYAFPNHGASFDAVFTSRAARDFAAWLHRYTSGDYTVSAADDGRYTSFGARFELAGITVKLGMTVYHDRLSAEQAHQIVADAVEDAWPAHEAVVV